MLLKNTLLVGSDANNGAKASVSNFNSNNGVSNSNRNISFRTYCELNFFVFFLFVSILRNSGGLWLCLLAEDNVDEYK